MILLFEVHLSFILLLEQSIWPAALSYTSVLGRLIYTTRRAQAHQGNEEVFVGSRFLLKRQLASVSFALCLCPSNMIKELVVPASRSQAAEHLILLIDYISDAEDSIILQFSLLMVLCLARLGYSSGSCSSMLAGCAPRLQQISNIFHGAVLHLS